MSIKEGRKRLIEAFDEIVHKTSRSEFLEAPPGPLYGVVICLTGLASDRKEKLHALAEKLGGRYTRDFNLDKNTHLVAEVGEGAKYELAASHQGIHIVTPTWLEECERTGTRSDERCHPVRVPDNKDRNLSPRFKQPTYLQIFEILLREKAMARWLFEFHQFYLLGFEDAPEVKRLLGKVIRRGGGTIHWELSDDITTLIVYDTCHEALRKAAQVITQHHPNMPPIISPRWVIDSFRRQSLVSLAKYPPLRARHSSAQKTMARPSKASLSLSNSTSASVFRGSLFALARIAPPSGAVDFDSKDQETIIRAHGGQILTFKLMDAMRVDSKNSGNRRQCFVVCWGGAPQLELNPLLSQLKRYNICDMVLVTPVWLKTCISLQKLTQPSQFPEALEPCKWPFKSMTKSNLRVSVTGFSETEKVALMNLMTTCGITFLNDMTSSNTHLVYKEKATGLKLQKAVEWGLKIVAVEWLYYVLQHGYNDKDPSKMGCEDPLLTHSTYADMEQKLSTRE